MQAVVILTINGKTLYRIEINSGDKVTLGTGKKDTLKVPELGDAQIMLRIKHDQLMVSGKNLSDLNKGQIPMDGEGYYLSEAYDILVYVTQKTEQYDEKISLPYRGVMRVGRLPDNQIVLTNRQISRRHLMMRCEDGVVHVEDGYDGHRSQFGIYLNGKRVQKAIMKSGDVIDLVYIRVLLLNSELYILNSDRPVQVHEIEQNNFQSVVVNDAGRRYRRSPRTRELLPAEKIVLDKPPSKMHKAEKRRGMFVNLLSSGAMIGASMAMGAASPALLAARSASLISPVANMAMGKSQSKKDLKKYQEYEAARKQKYGAYIEAQKALICQVANKQQEIISNENPSPESCMETVKNLKRTLWERRPMDSDFLNVRIGMGYEKLCVPVETPRDSSGFQIENDEINELAKAIIEETRIVDNVPSRVNLRAYHTVGVLGERSKVIGQIWNMLIALTTAHFYEDVRIVGFFDEEEKELWNAIRWLPHIWDENKQTRFLVYSDEKDGKIEQIMDILNEVISRKRNGRERGPHYIFVLGSRSLLDNTMLLKNLVETDGIEGITTLFAYYLPGRNSQQQFTYLPESCQFIVDMDDVYGCCAYDVRQINYRFIFTPDEFYSQKKIDSFCRAIASVEYQSSIGKQELPNGISFFQGMGILKVQQLDAWNNWNSKTANKSLMTPMAILPSGKAFGLDVVNHGPHGLVAGMTRSGKSELLTSWLLSIAVNYHPYDVSFLIIDYKGGGLADTLEGLPHMVGKITNIGESIDRSMASLKSEIVRRQKVFAEAEVNKISDYIDGFHSGKFAEPMPRLLLVADEFRELKAQEPEFLKSLVSVATIGASLGIHLVLATQNPSGIVDDQIRANSNFQICLKVQNAAASRDVIAHTEAALITQAGRAYIRVGADEVYELVQSYWSGAPYLGERTKASEAGNQVRIVETTGERQKTVVEEKTRFKSDTTELQIISKYLTAIAKEHGIRKMPCPWLPELPKKLYLDELQTLQKGFNGTDWGEELPWFQVPIGLYDKPHVQSQGIQMINFDEEGHYGIYGAPGSGKTTMLMTILMAIGKWYSPQNAKIYILDFNSNITKLFENMPHVAGVALAHEEDKIHKIAEVIEKEIEKRRDDFSEYGISSLKAYRNYVSKKYPAIILAIDNLIPVFEAYPAYEKFLHRIVSEAASYGIYLVYTANSQNGIKFKIIQNMRSAIAFELADKSDYSSITGKPESLSALRIKGRGLFKCQNTPIEFQAALYGKGNGAVEMGNYLKRTFEDMCKCWTQPKEVLIQKIPDKITADILSEIYEKRDEIPVGYRVLNAEPVYMNMQQSHRAVIAGKSGSGKSRLLGAFVDVMKSKHAENLIYVIDSQRKGLKSFMGTAKKYAVADDIEGVQVLLREILQEMISRQSMYQKEAAESSSFDEAKFLSRYPQICIVLDDMTDFMEYAGDDNYDKLNAIAAQKNPVGTIILGAIRQQELKENQYDTLLNKLVSGQNALVLSGYAQSYDCLKNDLGYEEKVKELKEGYGLWYQQGHCEKVKLPE